MTMTSASKHKRFSGNFEFSTESLRRIQQDYHEAMRVLSDHKNNSSTTLPVTSIEIHPTMVQRSFSELHDDDDDDQDIFYTLEDNDVDSFVFSTDGDDDDKDDSVHPPSPTSVIAEPPNVDDWMHEWKVATATTVVPTKSVLPTDRPSRVGVPSASTSSTTTTTTPPSPCRYLPQPFLVPLNARFCAYVAWSRSSSLSSSGLMIPLNHHHEIGLVQIVETHYPGGFVLECHREDQRDSSTVSLPLQRHFRVQRHEHGVDIWDGNQRLLRLIVVPLTPQGLLLTATTTRDDPDVIDAVTCLWFCLESYIRQSPTASSS